VIKIEGNPSQPLRVKDPSQSRYVFKFKKGFAWS